MSEQTCNTEIGNNVLVKVEFDYTPADPSVGLGEEAVIDKVFILNDAGFQMGNIIDALSADCLDAIQEECYKYMEGEV